MTRTVELHGVEADGHGIDADKGQHCATLTKGTPGVLQGDVILLLSWNDIFDDEDNGLASVKAQTTGTS